MRVTMKILKRIKETIKSHRELTRLKKELKEHEELLRYMEKRMIEDGWTWDFSGILPKLVKPRRKAVTARFQFVRGADEVKKEVIETIKQELDKAREEGYKAVFEGLDNIARDSSKDFYEGVAIIKLRNEIARLYKLKDNK
jgi:hypothetical protein